MRDFLRKHIQFIRAAEFALSAACFLGAWFAGGDMFLAFRLSVSDGRLPRRGSLRLTYRPA
jgi:hypothetical protein